MKSYVSQDNFPMGKKGSKGRVYTTKVPNGSELPAVGETVLIDGMEKKVLKVDSFRCVCGKCGLTVGILTKE